ncbi:DUF4038 domain-containing protein [Eudoraea chungangensis]|uniref:apiosidase-like domain-containing protein n=1 Tax=Eudoraea chungangensis TaxID=1481905 RepID=UPI0023EDFD8E|nr:DUF4038 domain-containing protein [Eudoraea chungangensis]
MLQKLCFSIAGFLLVGWCFAQTSGLKIEKWNTLEITLIGQGSYSNPYTDVAVWGVFTNAQGDTIKRPAFWDGDSIWKIRFTSPNDKDIWKWTSYASNKKDQGLHGIKGSAQAMPYKGKNKLLAKGLLAMSKDKRSVVHQNGDPFLLVADTPWAMPFRATLDQVKTYSENRNRKGFNAVLLMTLQPDKNAEGPDKRNAEQGFKRAFGDLSEGHINRINPSYFQYLDKMVAILIDHNIVPVYQPVFHGFGWKGLQVLGTSIEAEEYVRYSTYLLARYGSQPAIWLLSGDHDGNDPGIAESGEMLELWDSYKQPAGLHYNPCDDYVAEWAINDPSKHCMHYNKTHQNKTWLDFQWAQTGHGGDHNYKKVATMYNNLPTKAVANGEPTYEGMNDGKNGLGWWQGEEAWMQFISGATMGVVYGAASLWQWKISSTEEGWTSWAVQEKSWKEALQMNGSTYVGLFGKILSSYNTTGLEKRWDLAENRPLLVKEGVLYISYLNEGGKITIENLPKRMSYKWLNPKSGEVVQEGKVESSSLDAPTNTAWVLIIHN